MNPMRLRADDADLIFGSAHLESAASFLACSTIRLGLPLVVNSSMVTARASRARSISA